MNNKKQTKQPLFAEVNLTGDEFRQSPSTHMQRTRFLKLVYPNGVTLILPGDISASQLEQYIHIKVQGHRNPVMVRKDDIDQKFHIAPVHEELIWKSNASNKQVGRVLCRCSAHARRDHERALKENPKGAMPGMLLFQEIYAVEEIIKKEEAKGSRISELRDELARLLWKTFHLWCLNEILNYDQNSQMYKALNYVIRHYEELTAYLDIPEMPLDNNDTEREIRAMVMGKKAQSVGSLMSLIISKRPRMKICTNCFLNFGKI